jgi:hypothetical protein
LFVEMGRPVDRLSCRVGAGFHGVPGAFVCSAGWVVAGGQPGLGRACSRVKALVIVLAQGQ